MTALLVISAISIGAIFGMWHEYYTGYFDHYMRRITRPRFPTPRPVRHDGFLDDCEQFNRAMINGRVIAAPETMQ